MAEYVVLYNPKANGGKSGENARSLTGVMAGDSLRCEDITKITDYGEFFRNNAAVPVILCGGDGTLNRFVNATCDLDCNNEIFYFPCGTGNDFLKDICPDGTEKPVNITRYLKNLPVATVKGVETRFLNNVGFGIDGYCCQVGDEMHAAGKKNVNYALIAIKGLLGKFRPARATVTVDGQTWVFTDAWLATTMKGRFYGGGMMLAPAQDRTSEKGEVSVAVYHSHSKLMALAVFPSIFKGEHVRHNKMVSIFTGHDVHVKFNRPCALQIDGETVLDVPEYTVKA